MSRSNSVSSDSAPSLVASDEKYDVRGWLKKALEMEPDNPRLIKNGQWILVD